MDPSGRHEQESPPGEIPEASLLALDPRETDRLRERMVFYACLLGGIVAPSYALL